MAECEFCGATRRAVYPPPYCSEACTEAIRKLAEVEPDPAACRVCLGAVEWKGVGRPPVYCRDECRSTARRIADLGQSADRWRDLGIAAREAHVRAAIARRLAEARVAGRLATSSSVATRRGF